jgi:hypothetical protein
VEVVEEEEVSLVGEWSFLYQVKREDLAGTPCLVVPVPLTPSEGIEEGVIPLNLLVIVAKSGRSRG